MRAWVAGLFWCGVMGAAGGALAQPTVNFDAEFEKLGGQIKDGKCAVAAAGYDRLLAVRGRDDYERKMLRVYSLRGLRSVAGCYVRQDSNSACAALKYFNSTAGAAAAKLLAEDSAKEARALMKICGKASAPVAVMPKPARQTPVEPTVTRPAESRSSWLPALAGASSALVASGLLVYLASASTEATGKPNQIDFVNGSNAALESAGGWLMVAGGVLGAATVALWILDDDAPASATMGLSPTGLSVHGEF